MNILLQGNVLWTYNHELEQRMRYREFASHLSGVGLFYTHSGKITLTQKYLLIEGDEVLELRLEDIEQIFLGFDELYVRALVKNFGVFWQPLRVITKHNLTVYLIIDYNSLWCKNSLWFNTLKDVLS